MTNAAHDGELHITSCVAFTLPERTDAIALAVGASGRAEVARRDAKGRLVLIIEAGSTGQVLDAIDQVRALPGVLAVHLVYQHCEKACALEEAP